MNSFTPNIAGAKNITVSAASQYVDLTSTVRGDQVRIINTSTGAVAINWGADTGAVTAAFTDGAGFIMLPGSVEIFSRPPNYNRFAAIGLIENGYVQISIGDGV